MPRAARSAIASVISGMRVPGHRAGVAQAQVDVRPPVDVGEPRARGPLEEDRERAGPPGHPRHRHPGEERVGRLRGEGGRARPVGDEALLLRAVELLQSGTVDGARVA